MVEAEQIYAATSANRIENGISVRGNKLLFSRSHCPVIYDLKQNRIVHQFIGHNDDVNGHSFDASGQYVISTSYDKSAIIWDLEEAKAIVHIKSPNEYEFSTRCTIKRPDGKFTVVTTTVDGDIHYWENEKLLQTTKTKCCYFDTKLHNIPGTKLLLLILAGGDNKVHIYFAEDGSIHHTLDLSGANDWIKCIEMLDIRDNGFLLASASQDSFVRVWYLRLVQSTKNEQVRTVTSKPLRDAKSQLTATLETVLIGHEGMVHGLCWFKKEQQSKLKLVTCSADKTLKVWVSSKADPSEQVQQRYEQSPASAGVWTESAKLGETGEANLPFLSVCLSDDEKTIYSNSIHGAIHSWTISDGNDDWTPSETITGHFEPVTDLSWERSGAYLLSCSLDKTVRLHGVSKLDGGWHELARPQAHGHEINCIASINFTNFASGAEEKTIRTFEATQFFLKNFKSIASSDKVIDEDLVASLPAHAQLPALGLSNRAAVCPYDLDDNSGDRNAWYGVSQLVTDLAKVEYLDKVPFEEILLQSTLWWETSKLFGHANELFALAADSSTRYLASASKANRVDLANIIIWDCNFKYRKVATIQHHSLTITRLKFSPDDKYLLSTSRDRTWCLSEATGQVRSPYKKLIGSTKENSQHGRIIWDFCWTCDSKYFLTASRDKKAILWSVDALKSSTGDALPSESTRTFQFPVQAVDCTGKYLFAFGLENGSLELIRYSPESGWSHLQSFEKFHQLPIRRLAFQPRDEAIVLASAGDDCVVKLTRLTIRA